ncbi:MAG: hypothetical protein HGA96_00645 [Desulfobulbaceae bacterium]|nr:hypothetical protein [Desulfobulbaceae bacterium]
MLRLFLSALVGVVLSVGVAQAGSLSVSLNDFSAQMAFNNTITEDARGQSVLGVRGIYNDRTDTELVSAGLEVLGPLGGKTGLELGAGVRGYYVDSDGDKVAGAGLGGLVRFVPPGAPKVRLSGRIYYCPKILTGMDGERLLDTEVAASYNVAPRARVFLSYTVIKANLENRDDTRTIDDSLRGGLTLSF